MRISKHIKANIKRYKKDFDAILKAIKAFDKIAILSHKSPDFDALGSQFGLYYWIKDNFPNKNVKVLGEDSVIYTPKLYPHLDSVKNSWFNGALAIVVDCANLDRVSESRVSLASKIIKIDHHPNVEPYGAINFVDDSASSVGEMIATFILAQPKKIISKECGKNLFSAIVGDTGRFKYAATTPSTFAVAELLLDTGFDMTKDVYVKMYSYEKEDLRVLAYILSNFKVTEHGFAYYIIDDNAQTKLNIPAERGKENVNIFSGIDGIHIWAAITEDINEKRWRVSMRSAEKPINHIAAKWNGGGHAQASGASLFDKKDIETFINEIDEYLAKEYKE
ncbi:MAG: bifunctional oligoribonuclease/PAP phosphatase NrnA [Erysipelotrichaceae bacterium]|jgi:phosphoesterase RecJ-like protein|nr:bifunctional oligoribonuclease/PAP phosphatase NrnA [Bacillota bacterium]MDY0118759.1 bifunctional oligoribonuclease/PAP phosphatase NrnA [Bacilli bacterium]NLJ32804.1 bifunctional oligoribonuclease/PAP phosphatase NrnA [Erysipelotrichaceae bacterium]HOF65603.1 bifunctional oligoribonuclease/PAP phosphatase NrnA [Bacilli bacterium]